MAHLKTLLTLGIVTALVGCASSAPSNTATNEEDTRFPDLESTYLETGDFIDPDSVLRISQGQHKDQVRRLLNHPHFSEGIFNVREWDYAFNFYTGEGNAYLTCQYKLKFDDDNRVESTHWRNPQCPALLVPIEVEEEGSMQVLTLSGDVLFDFDSAELTLEGERAINRLASQLQQEFSRADIQVLGYTDRFGAEQYNRDLSYQRAEAVKKQLAERGMTNSRITTTGRGEANPVVNCEGTATPAVKECLKPNRRVEIEVTGQRR
ncbi:OmpA family protein [Vreelandella aquamarina]